MRKIFIVVFLIFRLTQLSAQKGENLTVKIVLKDPAILKSNIIKLFVMIDSTGFGAPHSLAKEENVISLNNPNFIILSDEMQTPYFIKPGETISVKLVNKTSLLFYIDGNEKRSNELIFFQKLIQQYGMIYSFLPDKTKHPKLNKVESVWELEKVNKGINIKRQTFLDSFFNKNLISREFYLVAKNILKNSLLNDLQVLIWNKRELLIKNGVYDSITNKIFKEVKEAPFYPYFIDFQVNRAAISMVMTKYLNYEITDSSNFSKRLKFINKNYNGIAKDFMLTNTIRSALHHSFPISDTQIQFFFNNCATQGCKNIIRDILYNKSKLKKVTSSNALLYSDTNTIADLSKVLINQNSEYIVLDFWASWCAPCREAMPASEKLRNDFKNRGIQFMYLSLDEDVSNWKLAHKFENLPDSSSFLILKNFRSKIVLENKIAFIPRYILISRNGNIINEDLPHIGDPRLVEILSELTVPKK